MINHCENRRNDSLTMGIDFLLLLNYLINLQISQLSWWVNYYISYDIILLKLKTLKSLTELLSYSNLLHIYIYLKLKTLINFPSFNECWNNKPYSIVYSDLFP